MTMILQQLSELYDVNYVFIYKEKLYEKIDEYESYEENEPKYRVILDNDEYDYIEDIEFTKELDERVRELRQE